MTKAKSIISTWQANPIKGYNLTYLKIPMGLEGVIKNEGLGWREV
jgi:hypothetical protein